MSVASREHGALKETAEQVVWLDDTDSESSLEGSDDNDVASIVSSSSSASYDKEALNDAILSADPKRLKLTLLQMCAEEAVIRRLVRKVLLVPARSTTADDNNKAAAPEPKTGVKRLRKAYEMCSQCAEEYEVEENEMSRGLCVYHPGVKEVDDDADTWADHDDDCHGPPDAYIDDPSYQDGFVWSCCDGEGDAEGCERTRHRRERRNRARH
ncbi:uncharacterized protein Z520_08898 [Fonsecaea multimorphosa CBS 102226]|uniref:C2H2-type domain-containing protein n=1 Tax=Fonsecaea multimorphosa CBS 102226 TaxID=1442371 RepID=A0A0D2IE27_9EURO|nr:uncharacterized protein Z520_08898 [Fonsecaea multimorphosa CBS 102226]KIX95381.1 hypothetical protein Z520_08898 [Fonsecaea multimorphosa CBS 102226]OAL21049.1 hypothetical protein AYO22_08333 [Fonsecaea multimorphosa]